MIGFDLTGGEKANAPHFSILLDIGPDIAPGAAIGDKGYASKANRAAARARGIAPVIPYKANEKDKPAFFAKVLYKAHARIEQGIGVVNASSVSPCGSRKRPATIETSSASQRDYA
ncbi:hypothetical protein ABGN05_24610 [Aquibium sp. LZ166]|uniref:Transposase n=2 Tax=Aquibium pacificus TaxID=3153579 RepID=A0ABV3SQ55_9HYPH